MNTNNATTEVTISTTPATRKPLTLTIETGIPIPATRNRASAVVNPLRDQILAMVPSTVNKDDEIIGEPGSSTPVSSAGDRNKVVNAVKRYRSECRVISRQNTDGTIRLWLVSKATAPAKTRAAGKAE